MNDRTTGVPNTRPGEPDPKSPIACWADDTAGRDALSEIQRRLDQTWDVEAGLQEILLAERYDRAIEAQAGTFDVEEGLAEIVGRPTDQSDPWASRAALPANDEDIVLADGTTAQVKASETVVDGVYRLHLVTQSFNWQSILHRIAILAATMEDVLEVMRDVPDGWDVKYVTFLKAMSMGTDSVDGLYALAQGLEDRSVNRAQAVDVVERAGAVCRMIRNLFTARYLVDPPLDVPAADDEPGAEFREQSGHLDDQRVMDLSRALGRLTELSSEASNLSVAVARLFDQSDDLVDVLL
ncbi:hypothetical protein JNW90_00955 [Micromonospora sp. STR1s_5]|nr:hypothetical protein [Micromonospora sp. STR1s_5]